MSETEIELKLEPKPEPESKTIKLAKEWHEYILKCEKKEENDTSTRISMKLPIETIDELPVSVELVFKKYLEDKARISTCGKKIKKNIKIIEVGVITNKKYGNMCEIRFYLYKCVISCDEEDEEEGKNWTISMLEKAIINLVSRLNNLKFNLYTNSFDSIYYSNMDLLKDVFQGSNITHLDEECCVCKDNTLCKTRCGHNLCLRCWSKLKVDKICEGCGEDSCDCSEDITEGHTCPICRSFMKLHIY